MASVNTKTCYSIPREQPLLLLGRLAAFREAADFYLKIFASERCYEKAKKMFESCSCCSSSVYLSESTILSRQNALIITGLGNRQMQYYIAGYI